MLRKIVVYVVGPYRSEIVDGIYQNIQEARRVAKELWRLGFTVICPHMNTALLDGACDDSAWLEGDLEILKRCLHGAGLPKQLRLASGA